jgi:hypothetical protein
MTRVDGHPLSHPSYLYFLALLDFEVLSSDLGNTGYDFLK